VREYLSFKISASPVRCVVMSERTGMCVSQVTDEVLYTVLIERDAGVA